MLPSEYVQKGWTTKESARDKNGQFVSIESPDACMWCTLGAIWASKYDGTITPLQLDRIDGYIVDHVPNGLIVAWNDSQETCEPIIKMLQEAECEVLGVNCG